MGLSSPPAPLSFRAWYWGYLSIYDSGGYIQELGTTLQESKACLQGLQQNNWISNRWVMRAGETQVGNRGRLAPPPTPTPKLLAVRYFEPSFHLLQEPGSLCGNDPVSPCSGPPCCRHTPAGVPPGKTRRASCDRHSLPTAPPWQEGHPAAAHDGQSQKFSLLLLPCTGQTVGAAQWRCSKPGPGAANDLFGPKRLPNPSGPHKNGGPPIVRRLKKMEATFFTV